MRRPVFRFLALILIVLLSAARSLADNEPGGTPSDEPSSKFLGQLAAYELAIARLQAFRYQTIDYPASVAEHDRQIALAETWAAVQRQRVEDYSPFRSFGRYAATRQAEQRDRWRLAAAEMETARLQDEQRAHWQRHLIHLERLAWQIRWAEALGKGAARGDCAPK